MYWAYFSGRWVMPVRHEFKVRMPARACIRSRPLAPWWVRARPLDTKGKCGTRVGIQIISPTKL